MRAVTISLLYTNHLSNLFFAMQLFLLIRFGSKYLVVSNDPDEMEKAVKHNDLIANCIMLQNMIDITDVCHDLIQEGYTIVAEDVSHMSPYMV
ncbi:MAG: Tn3 family transposase [Tatlockia sp.]|nr:Tn3 family transposase [Tatlockia sp.]